MRHILILIIKFYQLVISPDQGAIPRLLGISRKVCIYYPTCSQYASEALLEYGSIRGGYLAVKRILRCNPWHEPGVDLVPPRD